MVFPPSTLFKWADCTSHLLRLDFFATATGVCNIHNSVRNSLGQNPPCTGQGATNSPMSTGIFSTPMFPPVRSLTENDPTIPWRLMLTMNATNFEYGRRNGQTASTRLFYQSECSWQRNEFSSQKLPVAFSRSSLARLYGGKLCFPATDIMCVLWTETKTVIWINKIICSMTVLYSSPSPPLGSCPRGLPPWPYTTSYHLSTP